MIKGVWPRLQVFYHPTLMPIFVLSCCGRPMFLFLLLHFQFNAYEYGLIFPVHATQWKRPSCDFRGLSWELTRDKVETERQQISFTWFREISKLKSWESWNSFFNSFDSTSLKSFAGLRRMWCHYTLQCSPEWGWKPCVLIFISWICRKALA